MFQAQIVFTLKLLILSLESDIFFSFYLRAKCTFFLMSQIRLALLL